MKHIRRATALSGLLILLTFSSGLFVSALGQSDRQTIINIPFNFTVGEKAFPAGKYVIERNRKDSDTVWVIKSKDNADKAMILTRPVRALDTQEDTRLVFRRYDDLYFLSEFWTAGDNTGRELQISNRERALEIALAEKRQDVIVTDRGR
ncbi:MAG TPA: hypothetical protein VI031_08650 [Pyrinomonadaceae bacterium]